jgi:hypothetical protein
MLINCESSYVCVTIIWDLFKDLVALLNFNPFNENWTWIHLKWGTKVVIFRIEKINKFKLPFYDDPYEDELFNYILKVF